MQPNRTISRECVVCGDTFFQMPRRDKPPQRHCSRRCLYTELKWPATVVLAKALAKLDRSATDGCWPWTGWRNNSGYGSISKNGKMVYAHRFFYEHFVGPIPDNLKVLHRCDNPPCCRPDHLFLGTLLDNVKDMMTKGRQAKGAKVPPERRQRGTAHHQAKLTDDQVREIRRRTAEGGITQAALAREFGINPSNIPPIVRRITWQHVE